MMKYYSIFSLVFITCFYFGGCGKSSSFQKKNENITQDTTTVQETVTTSEENTQSTVASITLDEVLSQYFINQSVESVVQNWSNLLHPTIGVYLITRPAAFDRVVNYTSIDTLLAHESMLKDYFGSLQGTVTEGALPTYTCEEEFNKQGIFYTQTTQYEKLSKKYAALQTALAINYSPTELEGAANADKLITHEVVITEAGVALAFALVNGKWYLVVVDVATYDCSA